MKDPQPTFSHFVSRVHDLYPQFSYIHVIEPRIEADPGTDSNDFLRKIWQPKPFIAAGGFNRDLAMTSAKSPGELVAFGRSYIANVSVFLSFAESCIRSDIGL